MTQQHSRCDNEMNDQARCAPCNRMRLNLHMRPRRRCRPLLGAIGLLFGLGLTIRATAGRE